MKNKIDFQPKLFTALRNYSKERFMTDLMAGIIVGIVALPLAIAFWYRLRGKSGERVDHGYYRWIHRLPF